MNLKPILFLALGLLSVSAPAQQVSTPEEALKLVQSLQYQTGEIRIGDGLATLKLPEHFRYLGPKDTETVLEKLWNNPHAEGFLGMLLPADHTPLDEECWAVTISFSEDGYVKDDDASKIDYDDLLKEIQKAARASNKERTKQGYPTIEILGWATPPHYDATAKKLHWAKEIKFGGEPINTLNYNIRMLGRRGVLELNAIAGMNQLEEVQQQTPQVLAMVDFNEGHRYADFNPQSDKVAAYGIAALVAGGLASKLGIFKMIWVFLVAAKKFVIIGFIALAAMLRKVFARRKNNPAS